MQATSVEHVELLRRRIRMGLNTAVAAILVFAAADFWLGVDAFASLFAIKLVGLATLGAIALMIRREHKRRRLVLLALVAAAATMLGAALSAFLLGDAVMTPIVCVVVCIVTAAVVPWGPRAQAVTAAFGIAATLLTALAVAAPVGYAVVLALLGCAASIVIARELGRGRVFAVQQQRDEAEVSAVLARVGDQLTLEANKPDTLLLRTCRLVADGLGANVSHTFLFEDDWLVMAAAHGETANEMAVYGDSLIARSSVEGLVQRLRAEGAVMLTMADAQEFRAAPPPLKHGITAAIYFPVRRGSEMIGIQSAEYRGLTEPLPEAQVRLARGMSHLVSLAVESARLVQALEASDRVKTDFLANMSHELRTPLNVIIGYNDLLLEGAFDPLTAEQAGTLVRVQRSARELLELVTTTLELSRSDGQSLRLQLHDVRVDALIDDLIQEMRAVPRKPGVRLVWNAPKVLPPVRTDRRHLKIILKNLVDNAVKFTDRGRVTIEASEDARGVLLRVSDTGLGISPRDVERIFEPFHRSESPAVQRQSGVGLGLYIVRRLVDGLGGRIDVQSVVDRGSTFSLWLPLRPPAARDDEMAEGLAAVG
jgi:signal transduction histidine kinase